MTIDVYTQYFAAELKYNGVERRGALVKLASDSEDGQIRYTASASFFPYVDEEDYAVSYDAYFEKELYKAKGRRSKKREAEMLKNIHDVIDQLAEAENGKVFWDQPLRKAKRG